MKRLIALVIAVMLIAAALPVAALAETRTIYVSSSGSGTLNLRGGPGKEYEPIGFVQHGQSVTVLEYSGIWCKVQNGSGAVGWIKTKYIDGTTKALGTGYKTVTVSGGGSVYLRTGPGTGYGTNGSVSNGAAVKVMNTEDNWVKVYVNATGRTGWIMEQYIGGTVPGTDTVKPSGDTTGTSTGSKVYVRRVSGSSLNVRSGAGTGYGLVGSLKAGQAFKVVGSSGNWYRINAFSGLSGWVSKSYTTAGASATVTASSLNMRSGAGSGYKVVRSLPYGARVSVDYLIGGWAHVSYGGRSGFVSANYLRF